ncbi:hypothetical protein GXP70_03810 [Paenibacillus lycopersici]|uniref:Uncharacterized protein n=1 Tax=Paenibacillus lycopersici TaxID=2704462 RepID=A0A6C0FQL5_9BACL|nr:hypothetical protein [Paenibacillus lycopersici]QHT59177.1 hypothetical protein GXP70_03810 [Paenibacillus lycopersici]
MQLKLPVQQLFSRLGRFSTKKLPWRQLFQQFRAPDAAKAARAATFQAVWPTFHEKSCRGGSFSSSFAPQTQLKLPVQQLF